MSKLSEDHDQIHGFLSDLNRLGEELISIIEGNLKLPKYVRNVATILIKDGLNILKTYIQEH